MKKFFTFALMLVAAVALNAKQVTFVFNTVEGIEALGLQAPAENGQATVISDQSITLDDVVFSNQKVAKTDTRIWNSNGALDLRIYATSKITFSARENITAVEFAGKAISFEEFKGKAWVGDAAEVTFTATATCNINTITLTVGEPAHIWVPDTVTVAKANELIAAGDANDHFVKGVVKGQPFVTYADFKGKVSFWMNDVANEKDTIEFYDGLGLEGDKWESLQAAWEELRVGDTVLVYAGTLASYTNNNTGITFNEITGGYYAKKLGANPNPPEIVDPDARELPEGVISCADAVEAAKAIEDPTPENKTTKGEKVKVRGYVTYAYDAKAEKQSAWLADTKGTNKSLIQGAYLQVYEAVAKGDYVELEGTLAKYYKAATKEGQEDEIVIEVIDGTMLKVGDDGETIKPEAPDLPEGVLSCAAAVEEAAKIADPQEEKGTTKGGQVRVWGYVTFAYDAADGKQSAWLSDVQGSKAGVIQGAYLQVTDAVAVGDLVELNGTLAKYLKPGKNGKDAEIVIEVIDGTMKKVGDEGIENIVLTEKAQKIVVDGVLYIVRDNKMYNIQGARVR